MSDAQEAKFYLMVPERPGRAHLAPIDGGPPICGASYGRGRWAVQGIVPGVTDKGCPGCHKRAPYPS